MNGHCGVLDGLMETCRLGTRTSGALKTQRCPSPAGGVSLVVFSAARESSGMFPYSLDLFFRSFFSIKRKERTQE